MGDVGIERLIRAATSLPSSNGLKASSYATLPELLQLATLRLMKQNKEHPGFVSQLWHSLLKLLSNPILYTTLNLAGYRLLVNAPVVLDKADLVALWQCFLPVAIDIFW